MRLEENFKYYYHIYRVDKNYHQMLKFLKFQKINVKIKRTGQLGSTLYIDWKNYSCANNNYYYLKMNCILHNY